MNPAAQLIILAEPNRLEEGQLLAAALETVTVSPPRLQSLCQESNLAVLLRREAPVFVFPLAAADGALQGMLEFLGLPFAGTGLTGMVLCADPDFRSAVSHQGTSPGIPPEAKHYLMGILGPENPVCGAILNLEPTQPATWQADSSAIRNFAINSFNQLDLQGWALLELAAWPSDNGAINLALSQAWPWPDLHPGAAFRQSLAQAGLDFATATKSLIDSGLKRLSAEHSLRLHYKDRI